MKYEPIFGDQSLFNSASDDAVLAIKDTTSGRIHFFTNKGWIKSGLKHERYIGTSDNEIAMRRIIKTPVWMVADQKAGRLPEVGAKYLAGSDRQEFTCLFHSNGNGSISVIGFNADNEVAGYLPEYCCPIETPREKYDRERDECINKLLKEIPPSPITVIPAMKIMYEELKPFTGYDHD